MNNCDKAGDFLIYDLIIIGGGPAGYQGAEAASRAGLKVLLFETGQLGGTCLNVGCIPTKALLHSAKIYDYAKNAARYGVFISDARIDHKSVVLRKDRIVKSLTQSVSASLGKAGAEIVREWAVIEGKSENGFLVKAGDARYEARNLLIATGSSPILPPIKGLQEAMNKSLALTTSDMLSLVNVPNELVVIGGGIAGLELAEYYAILGSQVKVIEMLPQIGGSMDEELAALFMRELEQRGIEFIMEAKVLEVADHEVIYEQHGNRGSVSFEHVLVSAGRRPNMKNIGLASIGLDEALGGIETDAYMRTGVPGVLAAGDVNGKSMLAHTAYKEADVAVSTLLGKDLQMTYDAIPSVVYTSPEVAWVGQKESALSERGIPYKAIKLPMTLSGRYVAEGSSPRGVIKALMHAENGTLLGVHAMGSGSSEFIFGAALIIENGMDIKTAARTVFPHPTVGEVLLECLKALDVDF